MSRNPSFALVLLLTVATPVAAQDAAVSTGSGEIRDVSAFGRDAVTPTRIASSRIEMNRGRNAPAGPSLSTADVRHQAQSALSRVGAVCSILEVVPVGRTRSGRPLIEVDCAEGGGMIVADDDTATAVDCLDLAPDAGRSDRRRRVVSQCVLPANVAAVAAESHSPPGAARN
ncbi:hypothetical protein [Brevundimonas sp. M20]|uniref:hypothetical protein n=1 Tax=Brevundimonas sp. M20 TaxID=2591463 RepID=UPI0011479973|nr:hypothetical protein [Brevundimonas sp. M20]QDH72456.1 hypothetical protein FKQ52_02825 [Brevundimonas sp. M20]